MIHRIGFVLTLLALSSFSVADDEHAAIPKPTAAQIAWQEAELGVIISLDERIFLPGARSDSSLTKKPFDPNAFNPAKLDTDQWVESAKAINANFAVSLASFVGGLCQWPTDANPYSVNKIKWHDGKGDVVRDFVASCRKAKIKPGLMIEVHQSVLLSVFGGKPTNKSPVSQGEWNRMMEKEIEEICTRYGELFEIWLNGGGLAPDEGGPDLLPIVQKLQPNAIYYHTNQRRDVRWIGAESGMTPYPCWSTVKAIKPHPKGGGDPNGAVWCPAMADIPIYCNGTHNWLWAPGLDGKVMSLDQFKRMYYNSVGRNATLVVGLSPNKDGLIPQAQMDRCKQLGDWVRQTFGGKPLAEVSGKGAELTLEIPADVKTPVTHIILQEDIKDGERVREYVVEAEISGSWKQVGSGSCIGHKRIEKIEPCDARKFRLRITKSIAEPAIRSFNVR